MYQLALLLSRKYRPITLGSNWLNFIIYLSKQLSIDYPSYPMTKLEIAHIL